jgi:hypothetical protein
LKREAATEFAKYALIIIIIIIISLIHREVRLSDRVNPSS